MKDNVRPPQFRTSPSLTLKCCEDEKLRTSTYEEQNITEELCCSEEIIANENEHFKEVTTISMNDSTMLAEFSRNE
jgi:hypothetical protein